MPLMLVRNDITRMKVDAIVNAANSTLLGGGGVDGCIHRAAGPGLLAECRTLGGCNTGDAKVTGGYGLPSKMVIHTVGPVWRGGECGERELLTACYTRSLSLAREHGCETVAFPLISSGVYGYPKAQALAVARDAISRFLEEVDMMVYLVIFDRVTLALDSHRFAPLRQYLDDHHTALSPHHPASHRNAVELRRSTPGDVPPLMTTAFRTPPTQKPKPRPTGVSPALEELLKDLDESFSQMLLRLIDAKGMTDAQCYKKANIDRKLFSKIRSDRHYRPSKPTVLAFAIALELDLDETRELLQKAGFALSHSNKFDLIVEYFIARGEYDVFAINEALFAFDQNLLGS